MVPQAGQGIPGKRCRSSHRGALKPPVEGIEEAPWRWTLDNGYDNALVT